MLDIPRSANGRRQDYSRKAYARMSNTYVENGTRKPFRGGQLIGNFLDALANVCWSAETGFFGNYLGPQAARFNDLKLAG